jgi:hypothetical protein
MPTLVASEPLRGEDYTHSSNSLFHFMKKSEYLVSALCKKALSPRYCIENIEYLGIERNGKPFTQMAVLLKCFCDIPLHKITNRYEHGSPSIRQADTESSHITLYGEFALAFSKAWGEQNNLIPVHYLNSEAAYSNLFVCAINEALSGETNLTENVENSYLTQLAYLKPLRGKMERMTEEGKQLIDQNFYDEQEWRFIPPQSFDENEFPFIIANPHLLNSGSLLLCSNRLESSANHQYWLKFEYDDLRYIIVPDRTARIELIDAIMGLDESKMNGQLAKLLLISKILVLAEIRKDW